ncbi:CHAD domain-containing protein [Salibacterium salarium]|uniref:CHAD domain-containing protein n=1 Tax=Salibacterium salarium TaxID=284579 RepID=A0A428MWQ9_9BACI|nr:CHAD domain-containing protein [Salibacterium salarium]RSL30567.1 CHAD domain-containing protein [Salibacterium salarium]
MAAKTLTRQVDSMGRIVIPKSVRDQLELAEQPLVLNKRVNRQAVVVIKANQTSEEYKVLDEQGRLLIPADIRHEYNWDKGDQIEVEIYEDSIFLQSVLATCAFCESKHSLIKINQAFLCEDCLAEGNRGITKRWENVLDQLVQEYMNYCEKALSFNDIGNVHQARVKGRRLLTLLNFLGIDKNHKLMEKLQDAHKRLGNVRERDVLVHAFEKRAAETENIDRADIYRQVGERVDEKRRKEQKKLQSNLPEIINANFVERWEVFRADELRKLVLPLDVKDNVKYYAEQFADKVTKYKNVVAEDGESSKPALKALHEVRILSKELRYIYQYLGLIYGKNYADYAKQYKDYQRQFGDINDIRDWLRAIKDCRKK